MPLPRPTHPAPRRAGYTLLELTVSLPLLAMLMLGMASAIHLAARSVPDGKTNASALLSAASVVDLMTTELTYATAITSRAASDITFLTPDRTEDGVAETVRYQWNGTAGSPLVKKYSGAPDEVLLPSVQQFSLTYDAPLDAATGLPLLRSVRVQLTAPAGATSGILTTIQTHNRPKLP